MSNTTAPVLDILNLVTEFHSDDTTFRAVDDVSIRVGKGETVGIVGESGSGKSVTSLSIMGLIEKPNGNISNGKINFYQNGKAQDLLKLNEKQLQDIRGNKISMVFQEPMTSLNPVHTCGDQVQEAILTHLKLGEAEKPKNLFQKTWSFIYTLIFGIFGERIIFAGLRFIVQNVIRFVFMFLPFKKLQVKYLEWSNAYQWWQSKTEKKARELTLELFNKVKLKDPEKVYNSYPHELSGGQKQRVMIAMAISCNPSLLIADEPTTALDVSVQKSILDLIKELQQQTQMGVIFITHDLGVIAELANRVVVMYKGKIVEEGSVEDIFKNPQHPYTKGLLACRPPLDKRYNFLPTVSDFMEEVDGSIVEKAKTINEIGHIALKKHLERVNDHEILYNKEPIFTVKNLSKFYTVKKNAFGRPALLYPAVRNVSFNVYPGETLGLVGESGCGKTTLGRCILQLLEPTTGEVIYRGRDLCKISKSELRTFRKELQIVFQDPYSSLNPRITVGRAIIEPMRVHRIHDNDKQREDRALELLEKVGLERKHFNRYPHEFSGGQRQRICIARALALDPKMIICDESVSALDVSVQAQVLNLLNKLKDEFQFTYIFISHDLSVVKYMSDRILVMKEGELIEMGEADMLYKDPKSAYTKKLIDAIPQSPVF